MQVSRRIAVFLCLILLGACSDSDRAEPEGSDDDALAPEDAASIPVAAAPGVQLIDSGIEPRVRLKIDRTGQVTIDVSARALSEGSIGGESIGDSLAATYRLEIDLRAPEPGQISAQFSASDIEASAPVGADDPGLWEWRLEENGALISSTPPALPAGNRLAEMLSTHGLFLMVPSEPVGEGATWTYLAPGSDTPIEIAITRILDNEIEATISSRHETAGSTISIGASGRWDRRSLVATDATSFIEVDIESTTTRNGEEVPVSIGKAVHFRYGAEQ